MESNRKYSELLERQARTFRTEIYSCVKYQSMTMFNALEAFNKLKNLKNQYFETKTAL
jgi:hypothetical protein